MVAEEAQQAAAHAATLGTSDMLRTFVARDSRLFARLTASHFSLVDG
jgi:hypothetical protein